MTVRQFVLGGLLLLVASPVSAAGTDVENFYRNKTMTFLVSGDVGTGYDLNARLVARHMEKYLPGTRIVIQNITGAGGIVAANRIYVTRPEGLLLGIINTGLVYSQLLGLEGVRFDLRQMQWIGKSEADPRVLYTSAATGIGSLEALLAHEGRVLFVATTGAGSAANNEALLIGRILKLQLEMVTFNNSNEGNLSMMRGEVHGRVGSYSTAKRFVSGSEGILLASVGRADQIQEDLPDLNDFVSDVTDRQILRLIETVSRFGRFVVMPPGEDPAKVNYLREAYRQTLADPEFLREARNLGLDIAPMSGAELAEEIAEVLDQPPAVIELLKSVSN